MFKPGTTANASRPESSNIPDEQIIRFVTYDSLIGESIITHNIYLGVDKNAVETFEPLFSAFGDRLYGLKTAFGKVVVRFEGTFDAIDTSDFTDIAMTWNGEPLEFGFTSARKIKQGFGYEPVTDIYLDITSDYEKPGMYGFTGKYKDVPFTLYIKVVPGRTDGIPADPARLTHLSVTYPPFGEAENRPVTDVSLHFDGIYQSVSFSDFRDVRLTNGGVDVPFELHDYIVRHVPPDEGETVFTLIFVNPMTIPGTYMLTGYYRNEQFSLQWTQ